MSWKYHEIGYANKGLPLILSVDPTSSPNVKDGILTSAIYCITGIFPGTFISRKMTILTFSCFFSPAHTMAALILNLAITGCRMIQCSRPFLCTECTLIALRATFHLYKYAYRFVTGEYCKHVSPVIGGLIPKPVQAGITMYGFTTRSEYSLLLFFFNLFHNDLYINKYIQFKDSFIDKK